MVMRVEASGGSIIISIRKSCFGIFKLIGIMMAIVGMTMKRLKGGKIEGIKFLQQISGWSIGIVTGASPLSLQSRAGIYNPVLNAKDVVDVPAAFVADPFIVKKDSVWYMFLEVFNCNSQKGEIGLAISEDGLRWKYQQIVLAESFHLSYPYVSEWNHEYYMIPESERDGSIRLYKATQFPLQWEFCATLIEGEYTDTSILYYEGKWWMFTARPKNNDTLYLFWADALIGPWIQHPKSPVVKGNKHIARPAGTILRYNGRIIRYAQDCDGRYGKSVRAVEITKLTVAEYEEHEVPESPVLQPGSAKWNKKGMHTVNIHATEDGRFIAAVDGYGKDLLFIGF